MAPPRRSGKSSAKATAAKKTPAKAKKAPAKKPAAKAAKKTASKAKKVTFKEPVARAATKPTKKAAGKKASAKKASATKATAAKKTPSKAKKAPAKAAAKATPKSAGKGKAMKEQAPERVGTVYVDMVGDLFHWGHVEMLRRAKELWGHRLVVGVHADDAVKDYKRRPIMTMDERVRVVEACKYVDKVVPAAPLRLTEEYLNEHGVDLVVHGHTLAEDKRYRFMYAAADKLGKFRRVNATSGISTSDIIKRVVDRADELGDVGQ